MEVEADNLPEFFKVYFTQHSLEKMLIPSEFVDYMGEWKSGPAELAGPSGQTWRVELVQDGKKLSFTDGWQNFVEDNVVQDGNFLFFKFHGNLIFSVIIYDESMCEKGAVFIDKNSQGRDGILKAEEEQNGVRPAKRRSVGPSQPEAPLFPSEDKTAEGFTISVKPSFEKCIRKSNVGKGANFHLANSFVREHSLSYKSCETMALRTSRNSSWEVNIVISHGKVTLCRGWPVFARENNIRIGDICKFELLDRLKMMVHVAHRQKGIGQKNMNVATSKIKSLSRTVGVSQPVLKCESLFITEEQKAAGRTMPSSIKPSFVLDMKKYNVERHYIINIPPQFIEENSLCYQGKEKIILRNKNGSSWPVTIIQSKCNKKHTYCICGGWASFVRGNNIKEGDTYKFELVNRLEMKVHLTPGSKQS